MPRLLITSFNNPPGNRFDANMGEAAKFKKHALASGLITQERSDELWAIPDELREIPGKLQWGLRQTEYRDDAGIITRMFAFLGLSAGGGLGWSRTASLPGNKLGEWLKLYFAEPAACWVIGGHHHANDHYSAMCWGTEWQDSPAYRPYAGFGVNRATRELEWFGYARDKHVPRRIVIPGAAAALRSVSLIMVLGCNGVPRRVNGDPSPSYSAGWRNLVAGPDGRKPLVLGWFGVHGLPLDRLKRNASEFFWPEVERIAPGASLETLCTTHTLRVIEAWGKACHRAFAGRGQAHLWYGIDKSGAPVGAGAWAPDGTVYHANPTYSGTEGQAMKPLDNR